MKNIVGMSELVELIFGKKATILEETAVLTDDFSKRMSDVLSVRKKVIINRWKDYVDQRSREIFSSYMKYVASVMWLCLYEHECNQNIFDSFISVCALVTFMSEEALSKLGVDFRDLNPDIFMVFYRNILRRSFLKRKGFIRFVEYIRGHKYLEWISDENVLALSDDHTSSDSLSLDERIREEKNRYRCLRDDAEFSMKATSLVKELFSNTLVELPTLPSEPDLITRPVASRKKEIKKKAVRKRQVETSDRNSSSNSESKIDNFADQPENIGSSYKAVQAVIRHNHSDNSGYENANNQFYEEPGGFQKHFDDYSFYYVLIFLVFLFYVLYYYLFEALLI